MSTGYPLWFSCGFVIVSYVHPLVLLPSLVGRAGEVVVHVRGLNRHVSSKALLVFLPSFLSQVLTAKALAVILFILEIISYQIFFQLIPQNRQRLVFLLLAWRVAEVFHLFQRTSGDGFQPLPFLIK